LNDNEKIIELFVDIKPDDEKLSAKDFVKMQFADIKKYIMILASFYLLLAVMSFTLFFFGDYKDGIYIGGIFAAILALIIGVPFALLKFGINKRFDLEKYVPIREALCRFTSDKMTMQDGCSYTEIPYNKVYQVCESKKYLMITLEKSVVLKILPRHIDEDKVKLLRKLLRSKLHSRYVRTGRFTGGQSAEEISNIPENITVSSSEGDALWSMSFNFAESPMLKIKKRKTVSDICWNVVLIAAMAAALLFSGLIRYAASALGYFINNFRQMDFSGSANFDIFYFVVCVIMITVSVVAAVYIVNISISGVRLYRSAADDMTAEQTVEAYENGIMFRKRNDTYFMRWRDVMSYRDNALINKENAGQEDHNEMKMIQISDRCEEFFIPADDAEKIIGFRKIAKSKLKPGYELDSDNASE